MTKINHKTKVADNFIYEKNNATLKLFLLFILVVSAVIIYIYEGVGPNPGFTIPRRTSQALAMCIVAIAIAYSSVIFQTITNNRILTPAVIGFEAVYMFIQTVIVFVFSAGSHFITGIPNFLLSISVMMLFSLVIYSIMFKKDGQNILFLLLIGMVLGTMFSSLTSYLQIMIDPSEFFIIQSRMFASFNSINLNLLYISILMVVLAILPTIKYIRYLDVISLGKENAISLGINHARLSKCFLIVIAVLVSVSTALVGPVTFLGVMVANITYNYIKTYKHAYILPTCCLITILALVGGQYLVARVLNFSTTLSVIINFCGGLYFLILLLKENK